MAHDPNSDSGSESGGPGVAPNAAPAVDPGLMRRATQPRHAARSMRRRRGPMRLLKVILPMTMMVTIGYLIYWWVESRDNTVDVTIVEGAEPGETKAEVTVNDVKYDGKDDQGRPFSVTAQSASHADGDDRHIALKKPLADIIMGSGAYVAVTAMEGMLDRDADIVTLKGDVTLFHDNGLSFQTDSATIDLKAKTAEGSEPVEGQNKDGEVIAQGFRVLDDGDTIEFTGKAYMKIYPKQKDQGG